MDEQTLAGWRFSKMIIRRLTSEDRELARRLFLMMANVFGERSGLLGDNYLDRVLENDAFWVFAAIDKGDPVGGITAHALPMTTSESSELFIYDVSVKQSHQRQGIGSRLIGAMCEAAAEAGIRPVFVLADNTDSDALGFYLAMKGNASQVTLFTLHTSRR
ncbi:MAG TPA: GNAT family N-acetyltransferase [Terracidiphilus sp.]